jgi:2-amino-4-hydroxy-6-hydroxymethyldihydropteridine diphosphokinase
MDELHRVYLSLGSNIEPASNLPRAVHLLGEYGTVEAHSTAWETQPVGAGGPNYLNACVRFRTRLQADELKPAVIRPVEAALGRVRGEDPFAPRPIDLDMLMFDDQPLNLAFWGQAFVLVPLAELCPQMVHPLEGGSLAELAERLRTRVWMAERPEVLTRTG